MTVKDEENAGMEKPQFSQDIDQASQLSGESRRRFTKSGLAVSGVLMTLATRPVLGGGTCGVASPAGSIKVSNCVVSLNLARNADFWVSPLNSTSWSRANSTSQKAKFKNEIGAGGTTDYGNDSLYQVISSGQELDKCLVAALLNARCGWTPYLTEKTIKQMYSARGSYAPTPGARWSNFDIIDYLKKTQT